MAVTKRYDYRITFADGVAVEVSNCTSPGLARARAIDYQRTSHRGLRHHRNLAVVRCDRLPMTPLVQQD